MGWRGDSETDVCPLGRRGRWRWPEESGYQLFTEHVLSTRPCAKGIFQRPLGSSPPSQKGGRVVILAYHHSDGGTEVGEGPSNEPQGPQP